MMHSNRDVFEYLCGLFPLELQMDFDNSGFLLGRRDAIVKKALVALDVTPEVVDEAVSMGATLLISHHPVIFDALKTVTDEKLLRLIENKTAVISMHTNMDIGDGGVNDVLISAFGVGEVSCLCEDGCGRIGTLEHELPMSEFLPLCREKLHSAGVRFHDSGRPVRRLGVLGGAGGGFVQDAYNRGCDTYLTADVKYSSFLLAKELGMNLIDGDHFCTENLAIPVLTGKLKERFPEIEFQVSKRLGQTARFY